MNEENKRRWHNMLVTAFSDHEINQHEMEYLAQISTRLDISFEELDKSITRILTRKSKIDAGITKEDQMETLKDVICVSLVDGVIDKNELEIIKKVSANIGISEQELDRLIEESKNTDNSSSLATET